MESQEYDGPPEDSHVRRDLVHSYLEDVADFYSVCTSKEMGAFGKIEVLGSEMLELARYLDTDEAVVFDRPEFIHRVAADRCGINELPCADGSLVQETTTWVKNNEGIIKDAFSGHMISLPSSNLSVEEVPANFICWDILSIQRFVGRPYELEPMDAANHTKNVISKGLGELHIRKSMSE
jgi:hypothetical protein